MPLMTKEVQRRSSELLKIPARRVRTRHCLQTVILACTYGCGELTLVSAMTLCLLCLYAPAVHADVGDVVATISPERDPGQDYFCAQGLAFDGTNLYLSRCGYSVIDVIVTPGDCPQAPAKCPVDWSFDTQIVEGVSAISFDPNKGQSGGLWIGTQAGLGRPPAGECGTTGMPISFWDFADNSVTRLFTILFSDLPVNPETGDPFFREDNCNLDGLAHRENNPMRDDDDEIWFSEDRNRNIGVITTGGMFVRGYNAMTVDPGLFSCTGLGMAGDRLCLATGCLSGCGDVFRADVLADPLALVDQLVFAENTPENRWEAGMACDPFTFAAQGKTVMWVRTSPQGDPANDLITAYEIETGGCGADMPIGACCDPNDPPCRDVPQAVCGGDWTEGVPCAQLDPPCFPVHRVVLLDRTGSMESVVLEDGRTRCRAAWDTVNAEITSFFATHPSGSSVAVWTFAGTEATPLTPGFVDETGAIDALAPLRDVPCSNLTPLAEAACGAVDTLVAAFPTAPTGTLELSISSDGLENNSDGPCAGPDSLMGRRCGVCGEPESFDCGSWQQLVCDHVIGNAVVLAKLWGDDGQRVASAAMDSETGSLRSGGVPDTVFFQALAEATGGTFTFIDDNPPLPSGPPAFGVTGACCLPDGTCQEPITEAECAVLGGTHQGESSTCADAAGACCLADGTCQDAITQTACMGQGGAFQGTCTTCAADVVGACCLPDETCQEGLTPSECAAQNGTHQGGCSVCTGAQGECAAPIPTMSEWGLVMMTLLVVTAGTVILRRRVGCAGWQAR